MINLLDLFLGLCVHACTYKSTRPLGTFTQLWQEFLAHYKAFFGQGTDLQ